MCNLVTLKKAIKYNEEDKKSSNVLDEILYLAQL